MKSKWLISLGLVVCLVLAFCLPMCAPAPAPPVEEEKPPVEEEKPPVEEEAPPEEELASSIRAYIALSPDAVSAYSNFVKEKLGVELRSQILSCGEVGAKLEAEAPNFNADICLVCAPQTITCKKEGWSIPYASPTWQGAGDVWVDPDNNYFNIGVYVMVLTGNEDILAEKGYELPESWDDLLDPKWKGQIVMASPLTSGTAFLILHTLMTLHGGGEEGWEYIEALDKNVHHYTKSGNAPTDLVARGEFMLGVSPITNVGPRIDEGYPLTWSIPKEGTGWGPFYILILKGTEELYTCQKIVDLFGTSEACELFANVTGYTTKDPTVLTPLYGGVSPHLVPNLDLAWAYENMPRLIDEWKDRIGRVAK